MYCHKGSNKMSNVARLLPNKLLGTLDRNICILSCLYKGKKYLNENIIVHCTE